jgi:LDH2 family malate/lactate/ureidoglycolate dehydrogenase
MDRTIDEIKSCRKRPGVSEILVPGERSHEKARQNLAQGISIDETTLAELKALCEELGVEFTLQSPPVEAVS